VKALERVLSSLPAGGPVSLLLRALGVGLSLQGDLVAALRRVAEAKRVLRSKELCDPITLAIVELLALYGPLNVSELTGLMRRAGGRRPGGSCPGGRRPSSRWG